MRSNHRDITQLYLQLCYTCQEAHQCDTEEKCKECWAEKGTGLKTEGEQEVTETFLKEYSI